MDAATGRDGPHAARDTGTGVTRHPVLARRHARGVGRRRRRAHRLGHRHRPATGTVGHLRLRGASASARTTTWSTAAAARLDAPHLGPVDGGHLPAADDPGRRRPDVRAAPTSPRTGSRWPTAGSTTRTRDGSGSSTPSPARRRLPTRASRERRTFRGPSAPGIPTAGSTSAGCTSAPGAAGPGVVTILDSATGEVIGRARRSSTGDVALGAAYVDEGRSLLVGDSDQARRTHVVDAETLRPGASPSTSPRTVATPIGDGSTAMVYEQSGDGDSEHWRVIDVGDRRGAVRGGRGPGRQRLGRLSGRLDGRGGG